MPEAIILSAAGVDPQRAFERFEDRHPGIISSKRSSDRLSKCSLSGIGAHARAAAAASIGQRFAFGLYFAVEDRGLVVHAILGLR